MGDLGPDERVMPHRVLEWCQDAATLASSAVGYPTARYLEMNAAWYIRAVGLQLSEAIAFDETVEVETWVSNLRRFRSRREYVVHSGGHPKAHAYADWMFLHINPDTGRVRPFHLDETLQAAFVVDPDVAVEPSTIPKWTMPEAPPPHTTIRAAHPSEIDRYGHVNHVHYAAWVIDHAREALSISRPLSQLNIHYQTDVRSGQDVRLELEPTAEGGRHWLTRDGEAVARAITRFAPNG